MQDLPSHKSVLPVQAQVMETSPDGFAAPGWSTPASTSWERLCSSARARWLACRLHRSRQRQLCPWPIRRPGSLVPGLLSGQAPRRAGPPEQAQAGSGSVLLLGLARWPDDGTYRGRGGLVRGRSGALGPCFQCWHPTKRCAGVVHLSKHKRGAALFSCQGTANGLPTAHVAAEAALSVANPAP